MSFDSFDMNGMSPKLSFDIFTNFKMAGTSNSIATLNHVVKWRVLTFQACNTFYYKFSFLFQISRNWKETSQNTSQTSRIRQTKSRSQTSCHKVRNNQKTNQFDGFRKIFGRFTNLELATQKQKFSERPALSLRDKCLQRLYGPSQSSLYNSAKPIFEFPSRHLG